MTRILDRQQGRSSGILTGLGDLDGVTDGFQPEDLVLLAARPSMGKTSLALNFADHAAVKLGKPVLFVSLEMGNPLLVERLICARAQVDGHKVRTGVELSNEEWQRIHEAHGAFENAPLYLIRRPGRSLLDVANEVRRSHARDGLALVVIDYLQLIQGDNPKDNEVQALTRISGTLKNLAKELSVPVLALSQLNRNLESREDKTPRLTDLRGSGTLEQDADLVLLLHRPERYAPPPPPRPDGEEPRPEVVSLDVAKNRNGRVGPMDLMFHAAYMRFSGYYPAPAQGVVVNETPF